MKHIQNGKFNKRFVQYAQRMEQGERGQKREEQRA